MNKVCIIGAGSSGIAVCKVFSQYKIAYDCFESGSRIGGNWCYNNDNQMSSAYWSLHINTSKTMMSYSDFPMPDDYPDFPHHTQIQAYFEAYARHFNILPQISFSTTVTQVVPLPDGAYRVFTNTGIERIYAAVIVANGHHWKPRYPEPPFEGSLNGIELHAHYYKTPDIFRPNKNIVVVGIGNSALDIACEAARHTTGTVTLSTRRSAHIIPKYFFGKPLDQLNPPLASFLPIRLQQFTYKLLLKMARGDQQKYGVPLPAHTVLSEHPSISQDFLSLVGHGKITVKPNIERLAGNHVIFTNGSQAAADVLIYATGYKISFPFLKHIPTFDVEQNNHIPLYRRIIHPDFANLFFVGLVQPLGAIMPIAERQAVWIAQLLLKKSVLPNKASMLSDMQKDEKEVRRQYLNSNRHTIQVDFYRYMHQLKKELKV